MTDDPATARPTTAVSTTDTLADESVPTPALTFRGVSMMFADGTHALGETTVRRAPWRVRHRGRPLRLRQVDAAADRFRA